MGKIRVKTLGDEDLEKQQKKDAKVKKEGKKARMQAAETPVEKTAEPQETTSNVAQAKQVKKKEPNKYQAKTAKQTRSQKYKTVAKMVDKNKVYSLTEALDLLPKLTLASFDETVELHVNTTEAGISGTVTLPHGTGKQVRVAVADDKLIAQVEKGTIDFDVLVASPEMMPKLSRVAKYLGPRGLMPNPKNGTITKNPEEVAKKYAGGHMTFKTEAKTPIIHLIVGKVSFGTDKLQDNITVAVKAITSGKIKNVTLKSTMSPGIKIAVA